MTNHDLPSELTSVTLDKPRLLGGLAALATAALMGIVMLMPNAQFSLPFLVMTSFAVMAGYALWGVFRAPCPDCGALYSGGLVPRNNSSVQCRECGTYFATKDGRVHRTGDEAIEAQPTFAVPCPARISWPKGCCVCESPVARTVPIDLEVRSDAPLLEDIVTRAATLGTFKLVSKNRYQVQIPVCASHDSESARLDFRPEERQLYILFRSRRYANAFEQANGLTHLDA